MGRKVDFPFGNSNHMYSRLNQRKSLLKSFEMQLFDLFFYYSDTVRLIALYAIY